MSKTINTRQCVHIKLCRHILMLTDCCITYFANAEHTFFAYEEYVLNSYKLLETQLNVNR